MTFFIGRRRAEHERIERAIDALLERSHREGDAAAADEAWQLMSMCMEKIYKGKYWYALMLFSTSKLSFVLHAEMHQWFRAAASATAFATAVRLIDATSTKNDIPFPEGLRRDVQVMTDLAVSIAHPAGMPLIGPIVAESVTGLQMFDRTAWRELSPYLSSSDGQQRMRAINRGLERSIKKGAQVAEEDLQATTVQQARKTTEDMMIREVKSTLAEVSAGSYLSVSGPVPALIAASKSSRSIVYVVPGHESGAAFRLEAPDGDGDLCSSIDLPGLRSTAVKAILDELATVLTSGERLVSVRDGAIRKAHSAVVDAIWKPILTAWPDLVGGRVAVIPVGEASLLPTYAASLDGIPVCGLMDLTLAPSGNALMFAAAWPRPARMIPFVVADPWYNDDAGCRPIPFTVPEARAVAETHGVQATILRDLDRPATEDTSRDHLRGLTGPPTDTRDGTGPGLEHLIASANLIHIAGHGLLDAREPLDSAILLGRPMRLSALLQHDLQRGTTVVLSACHLAGIGTRTPGEQLGFPAAMLAMGASSVIAALWAIPDSRHTVQLMSDLHEELAAGTLPSAALGKAIARAAAGGIRPAVWGPLTHFGS